MDLLRNRRVRVVSVGAALATILLATTTYGALSAHEPPLEAKGDAGLRIRLVDPPKSPLETDDLLDVGQSAASRLPAPARADTIGASRARPRSASSERAQDQTAMMRADADNDHGIADDGDRESFWRERQAREDRHAWDDAWRGAEIYAERYPHPLEAQAPSPDDR